MSEEDPFQTNYNYNKITKCINCKSRRLDSDNGYLTCIKCGYVNSLVIMSNDGEWNSFNGENNSRCGPVLCENNPFETISTFVHRGSRSFITKDKKLIYSDISMLHLQNANNSKQKSFDKVDNIIENYASEYFSVNVIKLSKKLWKLIMDSKKIIRSGPRKGLIASCVYYSCINYDCPRSCEEISSLFKISSKDLNKGLKIFKDIFQTNDEYSYLLTKDITIDSYFTRFCSILEQHKLINNSFNIQKQCKDIHKNYLLMMSGTNKSFACAILYITLKNNDINIHPSVYSNHLGICPSTLIKLVNKLTK